jgi:hypothetical protein
MAGTSWPLRPVEDMYRERPADEARADFEWYMARVKHDTAAAGWGR